MSRLKAYTKVGFGLVLAFALVGNCAGKTQMSLVIFVLTALCWACGRICTEAFEALIELRRSSKSQEKKDDDGDESGSGPDAHA